MISAFALPYRCNSCQKRFFQRRRVGVGSLVAGALKGEVKRVFASVRLGFMALVSVYISGPRGREK
jgi:hypothetical protein